MLVQTPSQTVGPFFHYGLIFGGENILVNEQTVGQPIRIKGRVLDGDGQPIPDALVEIWQADAEGHFNHAADPQQAQADPHFRGFGRAETTAAGNQFVFHTIKPGLVTWDAERKQAPHINVRVFARGMLIHAYTRLYFSDERDANATDPVLNLVEAARQPTLIAQLEKNAGLPTYRFDIVLQGVGETVFFDP
ncbi:MAG: protocatechuate 3,4-dioxygenase subunit alpha [Caldilineaceae bacterium]